MKTDRITLAQLKQRLAKEQHISEREAATFLEALFSQISSGLQEDGQVRISGLGQLKIQWNEPRKSVDVNTGNEITISGYNKVTLATEPIIKERINGNVISANSNQSDDFDPIQKLGEQADAIMDIVADINGFARPTEELVEPTEIIEEVVEKPIEEQISNDIDENNVSNISEVIDDTPKVETVDVNNEGTDANKNEEIVEGNNNIEEPTIITPTPIPISTIASTPTPTPTATPTPTPTPTSTNSTTYIPPRITPQPESVHKSHNKGLIVTGIIIAIILLLAIIGYFVFQPKVDTWINKIFNRIKQTEFFQPVDEDSDTNDSINVAIDSLATQENNDTSSETLPQIESGESVKTDASDPAQQQKDEIKSSSDISNNAITIQEEEGYEPRYDVIQRGVTIAALARKYYNGQTDFWVYIYDANRDKLSSPNSAKLGMKLRIPYLDDRDPDVIMEAQRRAAEYNSKK